MIRYFRVHQPGHGLFLAALILSVSVLSGGIAVGADTVQDFTAEFFAPPPPAPPLPYPLTQGGVPPGPPPTAFVGGWSGDFLRLTQEVNSQHNTIGFDQVVSGPYDSLTVEFDLRISPGNGGGAD